MIKNLPWIRKHNRNYNKTIIPSQKQRISIARLFYSDRDIFFDETTNALDENNGKLFNNITTKTKKQLL